MNAPKAVAILYAVMSVATFVIYGYDKSAAVRGVWRIPERTLHVMAFACGWPGALLAQRVFRHKTRKQPFRMVFWATVAANVSVAVLAFWR